jgi:uncharacterized protein YeaO (DUF488 family)
VTARARAARPALRTKRAYSPPAASDGRRILIDRLWPRGLTKEKARIDYWARAIAPSDALRKWYEHDTEKWPAFKRRYFAELDANAEGVAALREHLGIDATLVFGSREEKLNNATALLEYLASQRAPRARASAKPAGSAKARAKRGISWDEVKALVLAYPGMSEGSSYGSPAFLLDGKFFARFNEKEQGFVVHAEPALRDALLASKPKVYFTTPHYQNYPALLVRLPHADGSELAALIEAAFRERAKRRRVVELDARRAAR